MDQKLTFNFDGRRLEIHPDLVDTFQFLITIDQENRYLVNHFNNTMKLKGAIIHMLGDSAEMIKELKSKGGDIIHKLTPQELNDIQNILNDIKNPVRSVMISLFAYMETLFSILSVYKAGEELSEKQLMNKSKNDLKPFIGQYILNKKNKYYAEHEQYFQNISAQKLIDLRNYLTHFYSVPDNVAMAQDRRNPEIIEMRKEQIKCTFIIPIEFYELLQSAAVIIINEWHCDALKNNEIFKRNMQNVIKIIGTKAAREVYLKRK